jgi:N-acetylneuraminic acid mutarotase
MARTLIVSDKQNSFFTANNIKVGTQIPTTGTHSKGDIVVNIGNNTATEAMWICVEAGTPGTWEVVGAGVGGGGSIVAINDTVTVNNSVTEVSLGNLVGKISSSDKLIVHYNSTHLMEGVDYKVNSEGTRIVKLTEGSWNESGEQALFAFELFKNVESVNGNEIVVDTKLTSIVNNMMVTAPTTEVEIGVEGFDKNSDTLLVFKNGVIMVEGVDYNVNEDNTKIVSINEVWNESNVEEYGMTFVVFKEVIVYDEATGGITMDMLGSDVRETINNLTETTLQHSELIEALDEKVKGIDLSGYATKEDLENVEVDLSPYQEKSSDSLNTNSKDIVGAINEVFQSGNNVKQNLVDALIAKGVSCSTSDSFNRLIGLIYGLTNDEGSEDNINENLPNLEGENTWATCNSMRVNRMALSAAAVDKKIYTFGGYNTGYSNVVEMYDTETGTWETKTAMSAGVAYTGAVTIGTTIYVFGGSVTTQLDSNMTGTRDYMLVPENKLRKYNTLTDTWTEENVTFKLGYSGYSSLSGTGCTTDGTTIYYTGVSGCGNGDFIIGGYNVNTKTFTLLGQSGTMLNNNLKHSGLCLVGTTLYRFGGRGAGTSTYDYGSGCSIVSTWDTLNTSAAAGTGASMPYTMHSMGYCVVNDKVYLTGGVYGSGTYYTNNKLTGSVTNAVLEYNPYTNQWAEVNTMLTPRYGHATAVVDNVIYVIGGVDSNGVLLNSVEAYCPPGIEPPVFGGGSGSSAGLNIISATELPETGEENQICVITDEPVNNYLVTTCADEKLNVGITFYLDNTASVDPMTGVTLPITTGNLTTNYHFSTVYQNDNRLPSYYYSNNKWNELTLAYIALVENGVVNKNTIAGDFSLGSSGWASMTNPVQSVYCSPNYDNYYLNSFANKINFGNYSKITVRCFEDGAVIPELIVFASTTKHTRASVSTLSYIYMDKQKVTGGWAASTIITFDISSWTGEYYLSFAGGKSGSSIYIEDIFLY